LHLVVAGRLQRELNKYVYHLFVDLQFLNFIKDFVPSHPTSNAPSPVPDSVDLAFELPAPPYVTSWGQTI
jgi:hypothetical protein